MEETPEAPVPLVSTFRDARQAARLPAQSVQFGAVAIPLKCLVDVAFGLDGNEEEIFDRHGVDYETAAAAAAHPSWEPTVKRLRTELEGSGQMFRAKARLIAEELLPHALEMATDATTPASVRADLIKWSAKAAELTERKDDAQPGGPGAGGFTFNLNLVSRDGRVIEGATLDLAAPLALPEAT